MADIYQGPDSCYAKREGVYVRGRGVNAGNVNQYIRLILRDLRRGWTYNHSCRRIRMTPRLAARRLKFLVTLAEKHSPSDVEYVERRVRRALERLWRLARARAR